jgi:hypothetical protein
MQTSQHVDFGVVRIDCTNTDFHRLTMSAGVQVPDAAMQIY